MLFAAQPLIGGAYKTTRRAAAYGALIVLLRSD